MMRVVALVALVACAAEPPPTVSEHRMRGLAQTLASVRSFGPLHPPVINVAPDGTEHEFTPHPSAIQQLTAAAEAAGLVLVPGTNVCYPDGGGQVCCGEATSAGYCCCQIAFHVAACGCVPPPTDPGHGGTSPP